MVEEHTLDTNNDWRAEAMALREMMEKLAARLDECSRCGAQIVHPEESESD